jgi:tellurite resistance protein
VRLLPVYCRLKFTPGFWSFTFPWSAIAGFALTWLHIERPAGQTAYAVLVFAAASLLIGAIAARSLVAIAHGQFLPGPPAAPPGLRTAARVPGGRSEGHGT